MLTITAVRRWTLTFALVFLVGLAVQLPRQAAAQTGGLRAFPGAEGYGAVAKGGRGGRVIQVTNLNDSGAGSFRDAVEASGPRIVVFRVGGVVALKSRVDVSDPYLTIAGQSAPGDGIVLRNYPLAIRTHDVIIRGLRVRNGTEQTRTNESDGIKLSTLATDDAVENIIIDHSSISWAGDEQLSLYNTDKIINADGSETHKKMGTLRNVTVQWSIVSEGLRDTIANQQTSFAALICDYVENVSFHHNLLAHHTDRSPAVNAGVTAEVINNVVYNWAERGTIISGFGHDVKQPSQVDVVGNYYKKGPDTYKAAPADRGIEVEADFAGDAGSSGSNDTASRFHMRGNLGPNRSENTGDEWNAVNDELNNAVSNSNYRKTSRATPKPAFPVTEHSAAEAYELVLAQAGALTPQRDVVDTRVVGEVRNGTGKNIERVSQVGGFPSYNNANNNNPPADTDKDGMPDAWERERGLDPNTRNDASGTNMTAPSGYMWVEEYLNSFYSTGGGGGDDSDQNGMDGVEALVGSLIPAGNGWSTIGGNWTIASESSLRQASPSGISFALRQSQLQANFMVEAQITPNDFASGGNVAVYARFQNADNYYRLHVAAGGSNNILLRKRSGGVNTTLKLASLPVSEGETYQVRFEALGPNLRAYVNGELVADVVDTAILQGQTGLGTYNASARFENVTTR